MRYDLIQWCSYSSCMLHGWSVPRYLVYRQKCCEILLSRQNIVATVMRSVLIDHQDTGWLARNVTDTRRSPSLNCTGEPVRLCRVCIFLRCHIYEPLPAYSMHVSKMRFQVYRWVVFASCAHVGWPSGYAFIVTWFDLFFMNLHSSTCIMLPSARVVLYLFSIAASTVPEVSIPLMLDGTNSDSLVCTDGRRFTQP